MIHFECNTSSSGLETGEVLPRYDDTVRRKTIWLRFRAPQLWSKIDIRRYSSPIGCGPPSLLTVLRSFKFAGLACQ